MTRGYPPAQQPRKLPAQLIELRGEAADLLSGSAVPCFGRREEGLAPGKSMGKAMGKPWKIPGKRWKLMES